MTFHSFHCCLHHPAYSDIKFRCAHLIGLGSLISLDEKSMTFALLNGLHQERCDRGWCRLAEARQRLASACVLITQAFSGWSLSAGHFSDRAGCLTPYISLIQQLCKGRLSHSPLYSHGESLSSSVLLFSLIYFLFIQHIYIYPMCFFNYRNSHPETVWS